MYPAATLEDETIENENQIYARLNETVTEIPAGYPSDTYTDPNDHVARVIAEADQIGPAITLKVMAGDKINIRVSSWYLLNSETPSQSFNNILADLVNVFAGQVAPLGNKATENQLNYSSGILNSDVQGFLNTIPEGFGSGKPMASVNWMLFDSLSR